MFFQISYYRDLDTNGVPGGPGMLLGGHQMITDDCCGVLVQLLLVASNLQLYIYDHVLLKLSPVAFYRRHYAC